MVVPTKAWGTPGQHRHRAARLLRWRYKQGHPCACCGERDILKLTFHHCVPHNSQSSMGRHYTVSSIWREMRKCVVLCLKCHRAWHHTTFRDNPLKRTYQARIKAAYGQQRSEQLCDWLTQYPAMV